MKFIIAILAILLPAAVVAAESPDGTTVPPAPSISVAVITFETWTLGAKSSTAGFFQVLRNGKTVAGRIAKKIGVCGGVVYVIGRDLKAWKFATSWVNTGMTSIPCEVPGDATRTFKLVWESDPAGKQTPTHFRIYRDGKSVGTTPAATPSYSDPVTATVGTKICYYITAQNAVQESEPSQTLCGTVGTP